MTPHNHPTVQIPQVFTAALAASVYICVAQRLGSYFVDNEHLTGTKTDWQELGFGSFTLLLVLLWTAKNSIDEFKSFGRDPGSAFSLGWTILFSTSAYIALATTASVLMDGFKPVWGLVLFFGICSCWSWMSVWRYSREPATAIDPEKHERRKIWAVVYPLQAAVMFILTKDQSLAVTAIFMSLSLGAFAWDAWHSGTFSSSSNVGA